MLTVDQTGTGLDISRNLLSCYEDPGDFIERVVAQDETWVNHKDAEQTMEAPPGSPPP